MDYLVITGLEMISENLNLELDHENKHFCKSFLLSSF